MRRFCISAVLTLLLVSLAAPVFAATADAQVSADRTYFTR